MENTPVSTFRRRHVLEKCNGGADCANQHEDPPFPHETDGSNVLPNTQTSFWNAGEACIPDSRGRYGSSIGSPQHIEYTYQLETKPDVPEAVVTFAIVPLLESHISSILVPVMFEDTCARSGTRQRLRRLQGTTAATADGFTPFPPDRIETSAQCDNGSLTDDENNCFVVVGNSTVYSKNPLDKSMIDRARTFVIKGMEEGVFDNLYDGIVGVQYRSTVEPAITTETVARSAADDSNSSAKIWGPIVGVVAICAVVAAALLVRRQVKKQQRRGSNVPIGIRPSTVEDFSEQEFDDQTQSSWNVLQMSPSREARKELGISARELADSPLCLDQTITSSWNVLLQCSPSSREKSSERSSQDEGPWDVSM